jgi:hypothetical protein
MLEGQNVHNLLATMGTQHNGGLTDKDNNNIIGVQDKAVGPKGLQIVVGLVERSAQGICELRCGGGSAHDQVVYQGGHPPQSIVRQPIEAQDIMDEDAWQKYLVDCQSQQRHSKKALKFEVVERKEKNMPPHKVQVTKHGKIDGAYERKDAWDGAIRSYAPHILDMAIVKVIDQNVVNMATFHQRMDKKFEYLGHELSDGFKDSVKRFMKGEWAQLKNGI